MQNDTPAHALHGLIWYYLGMGSRQMIGPITRYIAAQLMARKDVLGLSYDALCALADLGKPTVLDALKANRAIAVETYVALCQALGLDPAALLDEACDATASTNADMLTLAADHPDHDETSGGL